MHVGFVGTGNMGHPMAVNVAKAGHQLTVWDVRPEATAELEGMGARRAADLPSLAREVRVTLLSLPTEDIVERVVLGEPGRPGLAAGARQGDVIFDLSTVSPGSTRRLAARAARLAAVCSVTGAASRGARRTAGRAPRPPRPGRGTRRGCARSARAGRRALSSAG